MKTDVNPLLPVFYPQLGRNNITNWEVTALPAAPTTSRYRRVTSVGCVLFPVPTLWASSLFGTWRIRKWMYFYFHDPDKNTHATLIILRIYVELNTGNIIEEENNSSYNCYL